MDAEDELAQLSRAFEDAYSGAAKAKAGQESSETLIACAEYELEQLKKSFADARLEIEPRLAKRSVPVVTTAAFAGKQRKLVVVEEASAPAVLRLSA